MVMKMDEVKKSYLINLKETDQVHEEVCKIVSLIFPKFDFKSFTTVIQRGPPPGRGGRETGERRAVISTALIFVSFKTFRKPSVDNAAVYAACNQIDRMSSFAA